MTHSASEMGLRDCVPVFRTGAHVQNPETDCDLKLVQTSKEDVYTVAEAINTLISFGWLTGCDGELLPPRWFRRARG